MDAANTNISGTVIDSKIVNDTLISGSYGKVLSNQEIEEFGRNGRFIEFSDEISKLTPSKSVQNKSDILRKLLDDNQKTYS